MLALSSPLVTTNVTTCSVVSRKSTISPCTRGVTFDCEANATSVRMWVRRGCRGSFACGAMVGVHCGDWRNHGSTKSRCDCGSPSRVAVSRPLGSPTTCRVKMQAQISRKPCTLGLTYDCYPGGQRMWLSHGCRGKFSCSGSEVDCGVATGAIGSESYNCTCLRDGIDSFAYPTTHSSVKMLKAATGAATNRELSSSPDG